MNFRPPPGAGLLAAVYGAGVLLRNQLYDRKILSAYRSRLPVVSIGNINVGGSGKTPLCLLLAACLRERGYSPVILSRGYGGSEGGPLLVRKDHLPEAVGDEPLLLALRGVAPVVVASRRTAGARYIEEGKLGNVILLDDGFQHRALARDVDIVCVDLSTSSVMSDLIDGNMLPSGTCRENPKRALRRANFVVLSERKVSDAPLAIPQKFKALLPEALPVHHARLKFGNFRSLTDAGEFSSGAAAVVCGIANPQGFLDTLVSLGIEIREQFLFPDHHPFSSRDLQAIRSKIGDLPILCTEKDGVKLRHCGAENAFELLVDVTLSQQEDFFDGVVGRIKERLVT